MNAQQAIELSVAENRTVTLADPTDDDIFTLQVECSDDCCGTGSEFWGTADNGNTWRVTVK